MEQENIFVKGNILKSNLRSDEYPLFIEVMSQERAYHGYLKAKVVFDATIEHDFDIDIDYNDGCGIDESLLKGYVDDWNYSNRYDQEVWAKASQEEVDEFLQIFYNRNCLHGIVYRIDNTVNIVPNTTEVDGAEILGTVELMPTCKPDEDDVYWFDSDENRMPTEGYSIFLPQEKNRKWFLINKVTKI